MDWCDRCYNSGRIGNDSVITYCDCKYGLAFKSVNYKLLYERANLPSILSDLTMEDYSLTKNYNTGEELSPAQTKTKTYVKKVVGEYQENIANVLQNRDIALPVFGSEEAWFGNNIIFYGGDDSGKSMLAVNILKSAIDATRLATSAYYVLWDDLLSHLLLFDSDWYHLTKLCRDAGILCVDSIAPTKMGQDKYEHVNARLNTVIKNRLLRRKPTLLTTSHSPNTLKENNSAFSPMINKSLKVKLD